MAGQHHAHGLGQQGCHGDALGLELLVEGIELGGGDGVAHPEAGHRQAGHHVAVDCVLEGVEADALARTPEGLTGGRWRR